MLLQEKAGGEYRENKVSGNSAMNVLLDGECTGVLFDNVIVDGAGGGVLIKGESTASLIGNRVSANARANIALFENANPVVEQNSIQQGHGRGIVVTGSARGAIRYNVIRGHECEGVYVCGNATPSVTENVIGDSTGHGILIEDQARGEYFDNVLSDNSDGGVQHNPGPNSDRADADPVDASEHPGRPLAPGPDPLNLNANPTILRNVVTADPDPDRDSPPADPAALDVGHGPLPGLLGPRPGSGAPAGAGSFKLFRAGSARAWRTVLWQHFVQFVNPGAAKPTLFVVGCSTSPPESEASLLGRVPSGTDNVAAGVQSRDVTSSRRSSHVGALCRASNALAMKCPVLTYGVCCYQADSAEPYWDIEGCHTAAPTGASTAPTGATEAPTGARAAPEPEARDCKSRSRGPGVTGAEEVKRRVTGGGHVTHPGHGRFTMLLRENSEPGTGATEFSSASRARPREDAAVCASG